MVKEQLLSNAVLLSTISLSSPSLPVTVMLNLGNRSEVVVISQRAVKDDGWWN